MKSILNNPPLAAAIAGVMLFAALISVFWISDTTPNASSSRGAEILTQIYVRDVTIQTLLSEPDRYANKSIRTTGTVEGLFGLLDCKSFTINDGSGTIRVGSSRTILPQPGARVSVTGELKALLVGTQQIFVLVENNAANCVAELANQLK